MKKQINFIPFLQLLILKKCSYKRANEANEEESPETHKTADTSHPFSMASVEGMKQNEKNTLLYSSRFFTERRKGFAINFDTSCTAKVQHVHPSRSISQTELMV